MSAQHELNGKSTVPFPYVAFPQHALKALAAGTIKPVDIAVLAMILKFRKNGNTNAWVKMDTLVRLTGVSMTHLKRSMRRLTKTLLIERQTCGRPDPLDLENMTGYRFELLFATSMHALGGPPAARPPAAGPRAAPKLDGRKKLDGKNPGGCPPSSPPAPWDPRQQECIDLATSRWGACNGDYIVGDLLLSYSAELVMEAIDRHFAKVGPGLRPALLIATARGMFADGWTSESNGKPAPANGNGHVAKTYGIRPGP